MALGVGKFVAGLLTVGAINVLAAPLTLRRHRFVEQIHVDRSMESAKNTVLVDFTPRWKKAISKAKAKEAKDVVSRTKFENEINPTLPPMPEADAGFPDYEIPNGTAIVEQLNGVNVTLNQVDNIINLVNDTAQEILTDQVAIGVQSAMSMLEGAKAAAKGLQVFGVFDASTWVDGFVEKMVGFVDDLQGAQDIVRQSLNEQLVNIEVLFAQAYYVFMEKFTAAIMQIDEFAHLVDAIDASKYQIGADTQSLLRQGQQTDAYHRAEVAVQADHLTQMKEAIVFANASVTVFYNLVNSLNMTVIEMMDTMINASELALDNLNSSCAMAITDDVDGFPDMLVAQVRSVCPQALTIMDLLRSKRDEVYLVVQSRIASSMVVVDQLYSTADALALRLYGLVQFVEAAKAARDNKDQMHPSMFSIKGKAKQADALELVKSAI